MKHNATCSPSPCGRSWMTSRGSRCCGRATSDDGVPPGVIGSQVDRLHLDGSAGRGRVDDVASPVVQPDMVKEAGPISWVVEEEQVTGPDLPERHRRHRGRLITGNARQSDPGGLKPHVSREARAVETDG